MMREWRISQLGDLTNNFDGKRKPVKEADRHPGPYPYYGASGIVDSVDNYLFDGDYLLVAEDGENLRTRQTPIAFMATGKFWVNNHAHIITGNEQADTRFLMYALQGTDINGYITGAVMPKLTQGNLNMIEIAHPPIEEQRAIAHILGTLDDKIELNRRMNQTLEDMARALFKSWFVDFDGVAPEDMQESELGLIPKEWRVGTLAKFTKIKNGYAFASKDWREKGTPVVKIGSIKPSFVDLNEVSFIDDELATDRQTFRLDIGDMLVGLTGYVGETGRIPPTNNPPMLNQRVGKFEPYEGYEAFVFSCVRMPEFKTFAEQKGHGSAQANISTNDLLAYPVMNPGSKIINCFCQTVAPFLEKQLQSQGAIITLSNLRDTLLPKLISGELQISNIQKILETN
jgi:type I restriction enzyme S subunit